MYKKILCYPKFTVKTCDHKYAELVDITTSIFFLFILHL